MVSIEVDENKAVHIKQLARLDVETLGILADLSLKPGVEKKLKASKMLLKTLI